MKPEEKATATPATGTQHEHLLQSIWDHSLDALLLTAPDGRIFAANPAACRLFDRTEAEICRLGRNGLLDLTDPNLAAALADRERLDQARRELTCLRADGSRFIGEVTSAIFTDAAGQTRTSMIIRDVTERKRAEEEQREREAQYRSLFENSLMGISQALPNGRLIHVNQAYAEMYGYTNPAELMAEVTNVGQGLYAHPDDRKEVRRILSEKGVMEPREITVLRRDGSRFVVLVAAREIRDAAGQLLFYQAEHVDITARKRAEEALRQREAELNEAQRVSHVGNWLWEAATDAVTWSEEIYRIFGLDPTQRVPCLEDHQRILSPESWARLKPAMENTRQTGAPYELDLELVRPDGTKRWINARGEAVRDASGRVVRLRGTAHDITERKQAEEAQRTSEACFATVFRASPLSIAIARLKDGAFVDVNGAWEKTTGFTREEAIGRNGVELNIWVDAGQREGLVGNLRERGRVQGFEVQARQKSGAFRDLLISAEQIAFAGEPCMLTMALDITERKQAETYREMGREVLQILNEPGELQAFFQQVLAVLQTRTGCDAVGLRLQDGDDFTYCAQLGFSKDFLLKENTLIGRAADGGVCRDHDGNVSLECTCGLVLSGKTDPANPLFTRGGSFWTNDAFPLLDIPPGEDPRFHPRNECIHQGYASVALVPIRNKNRILGLLQFNDRRKGCFTLASVELLEEIAAHIGGALMRMRAEEALRASEEIYRGLFESSRDALMTLEPPSWKFTSGNPAAVKMFGAQNEEEFVTHGPWALSPERQPDGRASAEKAKEMIETALREGSHFFAWTHRRIGGEEFPADVLLTRTERAGKMIVQATVRDITERKQAEDELRRASAEWEQTFNAMPDLIMVLNREHRIVQANQAMVTRLGQDGAGLFGRRCYEVVHGTDAPPDFCPHTALLRDGQAHTIETTEGRIGGTFVVSDTPLCDARGTVWGAVHVARDITEHKRAEALLRQSEERFHLLFEQAADSILLLEIMPDGAPVIRDANNTTFKLLGYERDELIGQSVSVIDEASNAAQVVEKRRQEIHAGKGKVFEVKHRCKDGTSRDFECSVTEIQIGAKMFALSVERDITDRMRAAESQARLATAVEQAAEAIVITDIEGTIIYTNPAFEKITGYPRQEVYGHIWHFLQSGKHTVAFFQKIWAVLHAGQVWRGRLINKRKDGMLYEEDVTISPVLDAAGQLINYVAVKRDVTREVALETQIRQNAKMAAVGQLAGGVAHDFNNKLQIILFSVELLLKDMPRKHPFRADLQDIQEAARRSIDLTRQLLTFSRQQPITPKVLDLNAALAGSLKMLGRSIGENIRLTFTAQQELWNVSMDPGQLDQVLANLTVNARDAIAGAGMITIAAANRTLLAADCQDKPDFVPPGDYVELTVRDTGAGMTPEIQARIFEPFFTTKEVGKGTGLGLATVYGIVKQNNGGIAVQSTVGQGTTFSIYLPRSREAVLADTQTAAARSSTGTETILLVEDEERILDLAKRVLTKQGYQVVTALAPAEAVRLCASSPAPFHLLLTDVIMPGMSGLELAERLQKLQPGIRVLYMSGYTAGIMKQHGHLPEGTQVLQKPFTGESLTQHVRAALDAPPASRRNASLPFVSRFRSWWTGYGRV